MHLQNKQISIDIIALSSLPSLRGGHIINLERICEGHKIQ